MLIAVDKRFIFVANAKTASTSMEHALAPYAEICRAGSPQRKHVPWSILLKEYDFLFRQAEFAPHTFFKFGIIREPVDWVVSWFNYRLGNPNVANPLPPETDFCEWWRGSSDWVRNLRQSKFFFDADIGKCAMNLLIPFDEMSEAMPAVLGRLGVPYKPLPHKNKSSGKFSKSKIPDELAGEIIKNYSEDNELYEFWKCKWRNNLQQQMVR